MDDYIEKLFKQYPFIYQIRGKYYAFGSGVCAECDKSSIFLKTCYDNYRQNLDADISQAEAWRIFHKVYVEAEYIKDHGGEYLKPERELEKFDFNEEEMTSLSKQVTDYVNFWKKNKLNEYLK